MTFSKSPLNDGKPKRHSSTAQTVNKKTKKDDKRPKINSKLSQEKSILASKDKTNKKDNPKNSAVTNSTTKSVTVTPAKTKTITIPADQDVFFADAQEEEIGAEIMKTHNVNPSLPDNSITSFKKVNSRSKKQMTKETG